MVLEGVDVSELVCESLLLPVADSNPELELDDVRLTAAELELEFI
jgi:hypothetical protein